MTSAGLNASVTSLTLAGLVQVSEHRWLFFALLLSCYLFVLFSDSLVLYVICSHRSLHRPMFVFVAAVLFNSLAACSTVYPKLLADLASGRHFVVVSRVGCLVQAFITYSLGASSFVLLAAMAFDRYLSICRPLRYAALATPTAVAALLPLCWLVPTAFVGVAVLLAARLPLCRTLLDRVYCDVYSFLSLSCGGGTTLLSEAYGLLCTAAVIFLPIAFVLFSYARVLFVCLCRSRASSGKALRTCLPHLLVFLNYSLSTGVELLQRRLQAAGDGPATSIISSVLVAVVPTVLNPVVYGLKVEEVSRHVRRLLSCR